MWQQTGNKGNKWINGKVDVIANTGDKVIFEGATGSSYQGDIALDDIYILNGPCQTAACKLRGQEITFLLNFIFAKTKRMC